MVSDRFLCPHWRHVFFRLCSIAKVIRNPQSDRVVDGEVCGSGAIADEVQAFLHWVPIKLETAEALRLCVSCGDTLVKQVKLVSLANLRQSRSYGFNGHFRSSWDQPRY